MGRPKNPDSVYTITDAVTKETLKTNPKQFASMAERLGISESDLRTSFIGQKGRKQILAEKLTPEQAVEKYGIHILVAQKLRCTVKPNISHIVKTENRSTLNLEKDSPIEIDTPLESV